MKKRHLIIMSLAIMVFTACGDKKNTTDNRSTATETKSESIVPEKPELFEVKETHAMDNGNPKSPALTIEISLPLAKGKNADATKRMERAVTKAVYYDSYDSNNLKEATKFFVKEAKEQFYSMKEYYEEDNEAPFLNNSYEIKGTSGTGYGGYINYVIWNSSYTGGAHPMSTTTALCFDPESGHEITINDLFKDEAMRELKNYIKEGIAKHFEVSTFQEVVDNGYLFENSIHVSNNFILGIDKITFIYNPYEIAPYAAGEIIVEVPISKIKHLIK